MNVRPEVQLLGGLPVYSQYMDCIFCKFASGQVSVEKLFENEHGFVIKPIGPAAPFHALVIPNKHVQSILHTSSYDKLHMLPALLMLAEAYVRENKLDQTGYRTVFNTGVDAGQTIPHLHMHILGGETLKSLG